MYGKEIEIIALEGTESGLMGEPYLKAMSERTKMRENIINELKDYDAVIVAGPTNVMHFCGLPSVTVASSVKGKNGVNRGLMLYGTDEKRLYAAALAIERIYV